MTLISGRLALLVPLGLLLAACGSSGPANRTITAAHMIGTPVTQAQVIRTHICEAIPGRHVAPAPGALCPSPDGAWTARYTRYTFEPQSASLWLAHDGSRGVRMYRSRDACCINVTWARPHTLLFIDDYQLIRLNPDTRRHSEITGDSSNFVVSRDGRWLAEWNAGSSESRSSVSVHSVDGNTCLRIPHLADETDDGVGFTRDSKSVVIGRGSFDLGNYGIGPTGTAAQRRRLAQRPRGLLAFTLSSLLSC